MHRRAGIGNRTMPRPPRGQTGAIDEGAVEGLEPAPVVRRQSRQVGPFVGRGDGKPSVGVGRAPGSICARGRLAAARIVRNADGRAREDGGRVDRKAPAVAAIEMFAKASCGLSCSRTFLHSWTCVMLCGLFLSLLIMSIYHFARFFQAATSVGRRRFERKVGHASKDQLLATRLFHDK